MSGNQELFSISDVMGLLGKRKRQLAGFWLAFAAIGLLVTARPMLNRLENARGAAYYELGDSTLFDLIKDLLVVNKQSPSRLPRAEREVLEQIAAQTMPNSAVQVVELGDRVFAAVTGASITAFEAFAIPFEQLKKELAKILNPSFLQGIGLTAPKGISIPQPADAHGMDYADEIEKEQLHLIYDRFMTAPFAPGSTTASKYDHFMNTLRNFQKQRNALAMVLPKDMILQKLGMWTLLYPEKPFLSIRPVADPAVEKVLRSKAITTVTKQFLLAFAGVLTFSLIAAAIATLLLSSNSANEGK